MPSGVSSFGNTITSSSPMLLLPTSEGVDDEGLEPIVVGEEICVDENLGELEEAGEADSERGDGKFVVVTEGLSTSGVGWRRRGRRRRRRRKRRKGKR